MNPSNKIKAETDILVFKCLDHYDNFSQKKVICTPYQYTPIAFDKDGMCVLKSELVKRVVAGTEYNPVYGIAQGIHAFYLRWRGTFNSKMFEDTMMRCHWAIIPKGSEYYVGDDDSIASNELIIFKTKFALNKYMKDKSANDIRSYDNNYDENPLKH